MSTLPEELLQQLCDLIGKLRQESDDFREQHQDAQLWYNRGYANGMVLALREVLGDDAPCGHVPDDPEWLRGHEVMAWGKAYRHGESVGRSETFEISGAV
jgi:hypothetical protein